MIDEREYGGLLLICEPRPCESLRRRFFNIKKIDQCNDVNEIRLPKNMLQEAGQVVSYRRSRHGKKLFDHSSVDLSQVTLPPSAEIRPNVGLLQVPKRWIRC